MQIIFSYSKKMRRVKKDIIMIVPGQKNLMTPNNPTENQTPVGESVKKPVISKDVGCFSDVLKLVTGNGFVQLVKTLLSPISSRLYLPEFFGVAQNFSSIANIMAIISSLRYDQTVLLPKKEEQAVNQFALSLFFTGVTTPVILVLVILFRHDTARLLNSPKLADYLWLVPVYVLALGSFNALKQWNARKRQFLRLSAAQVSSEVVSDGMTAGLGFAGLASSGSMILSRIAGQLIASLTIAILILKEDGKFILSNIRADLMRKGMRVYKKFPLYNIWAAFLSNASLYIPGLLLAGYFSPTEAGYYSLGNSLLRLPVSLIANSIGQVFFQRSAKAVHEGRLAQTVQETYKQLVVFGLFPMLVVTIIAKELFVLVFGAQWDEAGVYSQILSLWTFFVFLAAPMSNLTNVLGKNEVSVILNVIKVATNIAAFVIGGMLNNARLGLWLFSISGVLTYAAYVLWANNASGVPLKKTLSIFFGNIAFSAPFLLAVLAFKLLNPIPDVTFTQFGFSWKYTALILFSAFTGLLYYAASIYRDATIREAIKDVREKISRGRHRV